MTRGILSLLPRGYRSLSTAKRDGVSAHMRRAGMRKRSTNGPISSIRKVSKLFSLYVQCTSPEALFAVHAGS